MFGFDNGYWLYINEAEGTGLVNTREGRLNQIGRALRDKGYTGKVVPHTVFEALLIKYDLENITKAEIKRIEKEWL